jgi:hypothetical protein
VTREVSPTLPVSKSMNLIMPGCIICYNEFGVRNPDGFIESPVRLPKCKHVFGDRCLKQWLQDSDSCPYCRDKLPSEPKRNPPSEDVRRVMAQNRYGLDPWIVADAARIQADSGAAAMALDREQQQYQQFMQHRSERREDSADEILARWAVLRITLGIFSS